MNYSAVITKHSSMSIMDDQGIGYLLWLLLTAILGMMFAYGKLRYSRRNMLASKLPGAPTMPLIGNGLMFIGTDIPGFVETLQELFRKYGTPQRVWLGNELWIAVSKPKDIEAILTSENAIDKCPSYNVFKCQADGIFVASGERWRKFRKLVNHSFHTKLLDMFLTTFNKQSKILVKTLEHKVGEKLVDLHPYVARCTLDIICGTEMGVKTHEQEENTSNFAENLSKHINSQQSYFSLRHILKDGGKEVFVNIKNTDGLGKSELAFRLTDLHRQNKEYIKPMHRFAINLIKERKLHREIDRFSSNDEDLDAGRKVTGKQRTIFLDSILDTFGDKSNEELAYYVTDVLIAGSDTTAVAISWTLLMMAIYPDIQDKVYCELQDIFGDSGRPCQMEDSNNMKYMEMVIKESLRHYTIPGIVRILTKELNIENYTLPVGTNAYISIYAAHRDPVYWQRPQDFYPEHFAPENVAARPKYSYMPFSMGPRNCPGNKFGMLSMKIIISQLLRRYKLSTSVQVKDIKHTMSFMLESAIGYPVRLQPRPL